MTRVAVLGAGVIGSTYAALLAAAGDEVTLVARGARLDQLRRDGVVVELDGRRVAGTCRVACAVPAETEVLVVAVRGDQLAAALDTVAAAAAPVVVMLANPLGLLAPTEAAVGRDRLVWAFAGVGGTLAEGVVIAHRVAQQRTVVEAGGRSAERAAEVLRRADPRLRREPDMAAWLATHTVFVAAMAALVLTLPVERPADRLRAARVLVGAVTEAFARLTARGIKITPQNLRMIFGRVPAPIAARYWAGELGRPVVTVSMTPHARATAATEQRSVARHALELVGEGAPRYRSLVAPLA